MNRARRVCESIHNFQTLNKPTSCECLFLPLSDLDQSRFQVENEFGDIVMCLYPKDSTWTKGKIQENAEIHKKIQRQIENKLNYEFKILCRKLQFNDDIKDYFHALLNCRIHVTILDDFKKGNCGELVAYCTFYLLQEIYLSNNNFSLEIITLSSKQHPDHTHVIGVIDRSITSKIDDPTTWGEDAVVYDPWNKGSYFKAIGMMGREYYKYGKWDGWSIVAKLNNLLSKNDDTIKAYEKEIITTPCPLGLSEYIESISQKLG